MNPQPFTIALVEPVIPPNTGNIARLAAATGVKLELAGKLGFDLSDKQLKRAGLDYWQHVNWSHEPDLASYLKGLQTRRRVLFSTKGRRPYFEAAFAAGDVLVFGSETQGLPQALLDQHPEETFFIPMLAGTTRSLNLATSVGIVLYEAIRQVGYGAPA